LTAFGETEIAKIVFKDVRNSMNQEVAKVLGELEKQLTVILGGVNFKDPVLQFQRFYRWPSEGIHTRIKGDVKQLFIYLQHVLMINVTQDLCRRLTQRFDELIMTLIRSNPETKQLENKIAGYVRRTRDLSGKNSEDHMGPVKSGEDQFETNDGFEELREHVERLLELTRNATDLLEYASEKFSDVSEQNRKLRGIQGDRHRMETNNLDPKN
jgi:ribosomal protein S17E